MKRLFLPLALLFFATNAFAGNYVCNPTIECNDFPNACEASAYADEIVEISYAEHHLTVILEEYGEMVFPVLLLHENEKGTSIFFDVDGITLFANMSNTNDLSIFVPGGGPTGQPLIAQLKCEAVQ